MEAVAQQHSWVTAEVSDMPSHKARFASGWEHALNPSQPSAKVMVGPYSFTERKAEHSGKQFRNPALVDLVKFRQRNFQ
eukprot:3945025-Alexandrium_andersonii.AAC.1